MENVFLQRSAPFILKRYYGLPFIPNGLHEHAEIIHVRGGHLVMRVNDETVCLREGDMLILPPFTYHQFEANPSRLLTFDAFIFSVKLCPELEGILSSRMPLRPVVEQAEVPELARLLFDRISDVFLKNAPVAKDDTNPTELRLSVEAFGACNAYTSVLVHELTGVTGLREQEPQNMTALKSVLVYCTEHYLDNISREDVADACGINPNGVSEMFSRIGTSFRNYINSHRISYAYALLRNTDLSIAEVMQRSGYLNQGTFNQNFIKRFGKTPREVRAGKETL